MTQTQVQAPAQATRTFVIDVKTRRPACALLQAAFGCDWDVGAFFDPATWLVAPTPDMQRVRGTVEEWRTLAAGKSRGEALGEAEGPADV